MGEYTKALLGGSIEFRAVPLMSNFGVSLNNNYIDSLKWNIKFTIRFCC